MDTSTVRGLTSLLFSASKTNTETNTRVHNRGLVTIFRATWTVITFVCLSLVFFSIPVQFQALGGGETTSTITALDQIGVSSSAYFVLLIFIERVIELFFISVSGFLFWRRSDDWLVWLLAIALVTVGTFYDPQGGTWDFLRELKSPLFNQIALGITGLSFILWLYILPTGHFVPRWSRWMALTYTLLFSLAVVIFNYQLAAILVILYGGVACAFQVYRFRYVATPLQRQQSKWLILGAGVLVAAFTIRYVLDLVLVPSLVGLPRVIYWPIHDGLFAIALAFFALTILFSVLRYRLWEVDLFINRSLAIGSLTLILGSFFLTSLVILQFVLQSITNSNQLGIPIVLAAVVIGFAFRPTQNRLQRLIDRRFYGLKVNFHDIRPTPRTGVPVTLLPQPKAQLGQYQLQGLLGSGGMGEVYKAYDTNLKREVALKTLPASLIQDATSRFRFEREAQVISALRHPNIIQVYDMGHSGNEYYMAMEYIVGKDLGRYLKENTRLSIIDVQFVLGSIAPALDYAHAQGICASRYKAL